MRAPHEAELIDILEQVGNADGCEWSVYEGPLFLDVRLPAAWRVEEGRPGKPVVPRQVVVGDLGRMATVPVLEALELLLGPLMGLVASGRRSECGELRHQPVATEAGEESSVAGSARAGGFRWDE